MFQDLIRTYLQQFQKASDIWWQQFDRTRDALNTPLNRAMYALNQEDFCNLFEQAAKQPSALLKVQMNWWESQLKIWQNLVLGNSEEVVTEKEKTDNRFSDEAWQNELLFNFIKQSYLLYGQTIMGMIGAVEGLDPKVKERLTFFSRQMINSMSPSNFLVTNPELQRLTRESNGRNLVRGMQQLKEDLEKSADVLRISLTNDEAYQLGEQIAVTPGDVVFRNELFELIQYRPQTGEVHAEPLLFVPPFINKYYILDLRRDKSMVQWMVERGYCVFIISWRNPGREQAALGFEQYVLNGVLEAVSTIEEITGRNQLHAAGYCIGGTLLAAAVAYCAARRMKPRIKTASYFTTILDFSRPGEIGNYINEPMIEALEIQNNQKGYMDGRTVGTIFSLLRENSLYWNYFVENYLKGNSPADFDILYWNGDSTNITAACHNFLLRQLYLENKLIEPKGIKLGGVFIDLKKIRIPSYFISANDDHVALWRGTYSGVGKVGGKVTFVLGGSGHIAGIINPPAPKKYQYWTNELLPETAEEWLERAEQHDGSWWPHWESWLQKHSVQQKVPPYSQGSASHPVLAAAPGDYVKRRLPVESEAEKATPDLNAA